MANDPIRIHRDWRGTTKPVVWDATGKARFSLFVMNTQQLLHFASESVPVCGAARCMFLRSRHSGVPRCAAANHAGAAAHTGLHIRVHEDRRVPF